ncbi:hypothetical protein GCM10025872_17210 [Barrientosiimonas endolithica]|uniref:Uncharacterized protein n=1 Tax=Barrientosiimonas endolithica TaxID=1535208 RepID=A0ABN6YKN3_9MICO|nr:hypothetical protein GCM10025872_17210 [Barrientosiimonas endolithica]
MIASGDMAHATHPNYAERHEPQHTIAMNGGPVLKINTNLRYATDSSAPPRSAPPATRRACPCRSSSPAPTCPAAAPSAR